MKNLKNLAKQLRRILIVDNETWMCRAIRRVLPSGSHRVKIPSSSEKALSPLAHSQYDLVLVDRAVVGLKGKELAARLKQTWPNPPIIMLSAFAMDFALAGRTFKCVDYILAKTFSGWELPEAINSVLPGKVFRADLPRRYAS